MVQAVEVIGRYHLSEPSSLSICNLENGLFIILACIGLTCLFFHMSCRSQIVVEFFSRGESISSHWRVSNVELLVSFIWAKKDR